MAQTASRLASYTNVNRTLRRFVETGVANTLLTSAMAVRGNPYRVVMVTVSYSAVPVQTGAVVNLVADAGAAYNVTLNTGAANAQYTVYIPANDLILAPGDTLSIVAPAAGGVIVGSVMIYVEELG